MPMREDAKQSCVLRGSANPTRSTPIRNPSASHLKASGMFAPSPPHAQFLRSLLVSVRVAARTRTEEDGVALRLSTVVCGQ